MTDPSSDGSLKNQPEGPYSVFPMRSEVHHSLQTKLSKYRMSDGCNNTLKTTLSDQSYTEKKNGYNNIHHS